MRKRYVLSTSVAAVLVAAILAPALASAAGHYLIIEEAKVTVEDGEMTAKFTTEGDIPTAGAFGYGVITEVTPVTVLPATAAVTTTHGGVGDSEDQVDASDPVWHNHLVTLVSSGVCTSGIEVGTITFASPGNVNVNNNRAIIQGFPLASGSPLVGASFTLEPLFAGGVLTNVCVNPVDFPQPITPGE